jgi:hypothetical protein
MTLSQAQAGTRETVLFRWNLWPVRALESARGWLAWGRTMLIG